MVLKGHLSNPPSKSTIFLKISDLQVTVFFAKAYPSYPLFLNTTEHSPSKRIPMPLFLGLAYPAPPREKKNFKDRHYR